MKHTPKICKICKKLYVYKKDRIAPVNSNILCKKCFTVKLNKSSNRIKKYFKNSKKY